MKEKCCIFYFYATLFSFLYTFCYFQTSPLGDVKARLFVRFALSPKLHFFRLLFLYTRKASLRVIQSQKKFLTLRGRITEHIKLLRIAKVMCSVVYSDERRRASLRLGLKLLKNFFYPLKNGCICIRFFVYL